MNTITTLAAEINRHHADVERYARRTVESALACGIALAKAKAAIGHGGWLPWLRENTTISERTARNYMRLARNPDVLKTAESADLSIDAALKLLADRGGERSTDWAAEINRACRAYDEIAAMLSDADDVIRWKHDHGAEAVMRVLSDLARGRTNVHLAALLECSRHAEYAASQLVRGLDDAGFDMVLQLARRDGEERRIHYLRETRLPKPETTLPTYADVERQLFGEAA